ncbi:MAG TPA: glycosyltransferase family 2 protein [Chloroflexia bacterium]|nr:glycosyltransferase family 2 protein [Chloroflexia bacterium]
MSTTSPDLSIIIVSWNVRDLLTQCLTALSSDEVRGALRVEIIVVDNASTDGSADAASAFPGVRLIANKRNLGYGRANNQGFQAAQGNYLMVLNPDTVPQAGSLEALVKFAETHPRTGIVAPRLLNVDMTVQPAAFHFPTLLMAAIDLFPLPRIVPGRVRQWLAASALNGRYPGESKATQPFRIDHPLGACMLINRRAYECVSGFDPAIFMYSEEVDLALRFAGTGWECWQVPAARVVHLGGQSTRQMPGRMFIELWRSRLYLYSKHYSPAACWALGALLVASQLREVLLALLGAVVGRLPRKLAHKRLLVAVRVIKLVLGR